MIRLALDLEMNEGETQSIIQVGACIFNTENGDILDVFEQEVYQDEIITSYITKLTKITQEKVNAAKPLREVYFDLLQFSLKYNCQVFPVVTWGSGDLKLLKKQLSDDSIWKLGRNELNVKSIYQAYCDANGLSLQSGLAKSMTKLGLNFLGTKHTSKDDSLNTARMYCRLLEVLKK